MSVQVLLLSASFALALLGLTLFFARRQPAARRAGRPGANEDGGEASMATDSAGSGCKSAADGGACDGGGGDGGGGGD